MKNLSIVAESKPQVAYAIFPHCLVSRWNYIMRTIPNISRLLQPLEDAIRHCFLPALTGRMSFSDKERESCLHCLPNSGVLGLLTQPSAHNISSTLLQGCQNLWHPLFKRKNSCYPEAVQAEQKQAKAALHLQNSSAVQARAEGLKRKLSQPQQVCMEQTSERGASLWLTTISLSEYGFTLH